MNDIIDLLDQPTPIKRPLAITIVCIINWAAGLFSSIAFAYASYVRINTEKSTTVFVYALLCMALCIGLWQMKRWTAIVYIISCIVVILIMLETETWVDAAVIPIASLLVIEWHIRKFKVTS